jgi:hypothetical protein
MQLAEANQGKAGRWTAPSAPSVAQSTTINFPGITKTRYEAREGKPIPYAKGFAEIVAKVPKAKLPELEQNWDALWPGAVIYKNDKGRHVEFFYLGKHAGSLRPAKNDEELVTALEEVLGTSDVEHTTDGARIKRIYGGQYIKQRMTSVGRTNGPECIPTEQIGRRYFELGEVGQGATGRCSERAVASKQNKGCFN